jgi:hypothetical protein
MWDKTQRAVFCHTAWEYFKQRIAILQWQIREAVV